MGNALGRGWGKDLGLIFANSAISGVESAVGQNFYQPDVQGTVGGKVNEGFDMGAKISGSIAPMFMDAWIPGSGQAINAARGVAPALGDMRQQPQQPQVQPLGQPVDRQQAYTDGNALYALGGQMPMPGVEGTGPNLYAFNGPSHAEGGMQFNQNAEIEKKETVDPSAKYVYSDQLKVPGTDKTFADMSKKWKGKDTDDDITKKTNTLMLARLRNNQEELKKIQFEKASQKFQKKYGEYLQEQMAKGGYYTPAEAERANPGGKWVNIGVNYGGDESYGIADQYAAGGYMNKVSPDGRLQYPGTPGTSSYLDPWGLPQGPTFDMSQDNQNVVDPMASILANQSTNNYAGAGNTLNMSAQPAGTTPGVAPVSGNNFDQYSGMLNNAAKYANIGYNAYQSMQPIDYYKAVQNPQYQKAIDLASNLRYDARPELAEARRTFAQSKQAIQDFSGGSAGMAMANIHGAQVQADRAKQAVLSRQQNMDNQYRLNEAQVRGNMGESYADELRKTQIYKLQAEAARRAFAGTAAASTSQAAQMNQLMGSQQGQDATLAQLLQSSYGDLGPMIKALEMAQAKQTKKK